MRVVENEILDMDELTRNPHVGSRVEEMPSLDKAGANRSELAIAVTRGFLAGLHGAIQDGADVRAYYMWSLMDNFEWAFGFTKRFGIVFTDFESGRRIPKASAGMYAAIARANALEV